MEGTPAGVLQGDYLLKYHSVRACYPRSDCPNSTFRLHPKMMCAVPPFSLLHLRETLSICQKNTREIYFFPTSKMRCKRTNTILSLIDPPLLRRKAVIYPLVIASFSTQGQHFSFLSLTQGGSSPFIFDPTRIRLIVSYILLM